MNQRDREIINKSCERLIPRIDMEVLWPELLQNRVFNSDDCNIPIWSVSFTFYSFYYLSILYCTFFKLLTSTLPFPDKF